MIKNEEEVFTWLKIPDEYKDLLEEKDSTPQVIDKLKKKYDRKSIAFPGEAQNIYQSIALYYRYTKNRYYQAWDIISSLYERMIKYQEENGKWIHKGMPLVWLRDFSMLLGYRVIAKRYAMLTLCEDVIRDYKEKRSLDKKEGGIYFRLAYYHGMSDFEIDNYSDKIFKIYEKNSIKSLYPEWILQELDNDWINNYPSSSELYVYKPNLAYIQNLLKSLSNDKSGDNLERLAEYILSLVPGFRTYRKLRSETTDYDILCNIEGISMDYRAEFGRYFICECKNWKAPADVTVILKFCSVLDSAKCKSGIIFSEKGISAGKSKNKFAERELLKAFQRNGTTILIVDHSDLEKIGEGQNLITLLRNKYEKIRFDLSKQ